MENPICVSDAVRLAKSHVSEMPTLVVSGEVSGFRGPNARSGHCYFQIKDSMSAMDVIIWRFVYQKAQVDLKDGMQIQIRGAFDVYEGSGKLSLVAKSFSISGEGLLRQQVAALAKKLQAEGLMDPSRKRRIPPFCTRVAVVTSLSGSVIDDVKRTLSRRNPLVELMCVGCSVQGDGAAATIIRGLQIAQSYNPDCILLVRGGGSFEDLMCFNDEQLARAVARCSVPVVTGIGHEPDTSICDMVADRRTSTPTAAAESIAPSIDTIVDSINNRQERLIRVMGTTLTQNNTVLDSLGALLGRAALAKIHKGSADCEAKSARLNQSMQVCLNQAQHKVDDISGRRCLQEPTAFLDVKKTTLLQTEQRLFDAMPRVLDRKNQQVQTLAESFYTKGEKLLVPYNNQLAHAASTLEALSPLKVLARGYAITKDDQGGVIQDASQINPGDEINIILHKGRVCANVTQVISE